jgi:hypothetical protein
MSKLQFITPTDYALFGCSLGCLFAWLCSAVFPLLLFTIAIANTTQNTVNLSKVMFPANVGEEY